MSESTPHMKFSDIVEQSMYPQLGDWVKIIANAAKLFSISVSTFKIGSFARVDNIQENHTYDIGTEGNKYYKSMGEFHLSTGCWYPLQYWEDFVEIVDVSTIPGVTGNVHTADIVEESMHPDDIVGHYGPAIVHMNFNDMTYWLEDDTSVTKDNPTKIRRVIKNAMPVWFIENIETNNYGEDSAHYMFEKAYQQWLHNGTSDTLPLETTADIVEQSIRPQVFVLQRNDSYGKQYFDFNAMQYWLEYNSDVSKDYPGNMSRKMVDGKPLWYVGHTHTDSGLSPLNGYNEGANKRFEKAYQMWINGESSDIQKQADIVNNALMHIVSFTLRDAVKMAERDSYEHGADPNSGISQTIDWVTLEEEYASIDELAKTAFLPTDRDVWITFDKRIMCQIHEDDNADRVDKDDAEWTQYVAGEITLWAATYDFYIDTITYEDGTTINVDSLKDDEVESLLSNSLGIQSYGHISDNIVKQSDIVEQSLRGGSGKPTIRWIRELYSNVGDELSSEVDYTFEFKISPKMINQVVDKLGSLLAKHSSRHNPLSMAEYSLYASEMATTSREITFDANDVTVWEIYRIEFAQFTDAEKLAIMQAFFKRKVTAALKFSDIVEESLRNDPLEDYVYEENLFVYHINMRNMSYYIEGNPNITPEHPTQLKVNDGIWEIRYTSPEMTRTWMQLGGATDRKFINTLNKLYKQLPRKTADIVEQSMDAPLVRIPASTPGYEIVIDFAKMVYWTEGGRDNDGISQFNASHLRRDNGIGKWHYRHAYTTDDGRSWVYVKWFSDALEKAYQESIGNRNVESSFKFADIVEEATDPIYDRPKVGDTVHIIGDIATLKHIGIYPNSRVDDQVYTTPYLIRDIRPNAKWHISDVGKGGFVLITINPPHNSWVIPLNNWEKYIEVIAYKESSLKLSDIVEQSLNPVHMVEINDITYYFNLDDGTYYTSDYIDKDRPSQFKQQEPGVWMYRHWGSHTWHNAKSLDINFNNALNELYNGHTASLTLKSASPKKQIFICIPVPDEVRTKFKHIKGLEDDLHITLAYIPDAKLSDDVKKSVVDSIRKICADSAPISCQFTGLGSFDNGDDTLAALVNIPEGAELVTQLESAIEQSYGKWEKEFGYLPHMTLKYKGDGESNLKELRDYKWVCKELRLTFSDNSDTAIYFKLGKDESYEKSTPKESSISKWYHKFTHLFKYGTMPVPIRQQLDYPNFADIETEESKYAIKMRPNSKVPFLNKVQQKALGINFYIDDGDCASIAKAFQIVYDAVPFAIVPTFREYEQTAADDTDHSSAVHAFVWYEGKYYDGFGEIDPHGLLEQFTNDFPNRGYQIVKINGSMNKFFERNSFSMDASIRSIVSLLNKFESQGKLSDPNKSFHMKWRTRDHYDSTSYSSLTFVNAANVVTSDIMEMEFAEDVELRLGDVVVFNGGIRNKLDRIDILYDTRIRYDELLDPHWVVNDIKQGGLANIGTKKILLKNPTFNDYWWIPGDVGLWNEYVQLVTHKTADLIPITIDEPLSNPILFTAYVEMDENGNVIDSNESESMVFERTESLSIAKDIINYIKDSYSDTYKRYEQPDDTTLVLLGEQEPSMGEGDAAYDSTDIHIRNVSKAEQTTIIKAFIKRRRTADLVEDALQDVYGFPQVGDRVEWIASDTLLQSQFIRPDEIRQPGAHIITSVNQHCIRIQTPSDRRVNYDGWFIPADHWSDYIVIVSRNNVNKLADLVDDIINPIDLDGVLNNAGASFTNAFHTFFKINTIRKQLNADRDADRDAVRVTRRMNGLGRNLYAIYDNSTPSIAIKYHHTEIITFYRDYIELNLHGFHTKTTGERIVSALRAVGIGIRVTFNFHHGDYRWLENMGEVRDDRGVLVGKLTLTDVSGNDHYIKEGLRLDYAGNVINDEQIQASLHFADIVEQSINDLQVGDHVRVIADAELLNKINIHYSVSPTDVFEVDDIEPEVSVWTKEKYGWGMGGVHIGPDGFFLPLSHWRDFLVVVPDDVTTNLDATADLIEESINTPEFPIGTIANTPEELVSMLRPYQVWGGHAYETEHMAIYFGNEAKLLKGVERAGTLVVTKAVWGDSEMPPKRIPNYMRGSYIYLDEFPMTLLRTDWRKYNRNRRTLSSLKLADIVEETMNDESHWNELLANVLTNEDVYRAKLIAQYPEEIMNADVDYWEYLPRNYNQDQLTGYTKHLYSEEIANKLDAQSTGKLFGIIREYINVRGWDILSDDGYGEGYEFVVAKRFQEGIDTYGIRSTTEYESVEEIVEDEFPDGIQKENYQVDHNWYENATLFSEDETVEQCRENMGNVPLEELDPMDYVAKRVNSEDWQYYSETDGTDACKTILTDMMASDREHTPYNADTFVSPESWPGHSKDPEDIARRERYPAPNQLEMMTPSGQPLQEPRTVEELYPNGYPVNFSSLHFKYADIVEDALNEDREVEVLVDFNRSIHCNFHTMHFWVDIDGSIIAGTMIRNPKPGSYADWWHSVDSSPEHMLPFSQITSDAIEDTYQSLQHTASIRFADVTMDSYGNVEVDTLMELEDELGPYQVWQSVADGKLMGNQLLYIGANPRIELSGTDNIFHHCDWREIPGDEDVSNRTALIQKVILPLVRISNDWRIDDPNTKPIAQHDHGVEPTIQPEPVVEETKEDEPEPIPEPEPEVEEDEPAIEPIEHPWTPLPDAYALMQPNEDWEVKSNTTNNVRVWHIRTVDNIEGGQYRFGITLDGTDYAVTTPKPHQENFVARLKPIIEASLRLADIVEETINNENLKVGDYVEFTRDKDLIKQLHLSGLQLGVYVVDEIKPKDKRWDAFPSTYDPKTKPYGHIQVSRNRNSIWSVPYVDWNKYIHKVPPPVEASNNKNAYIKGDQLLTFADISKSAADLPPNNIRFYGFISPFREFYSLDGIEEKFHDPQAQKLVEADPELLAKYNVMKANLPKLTYTAFLITQGWIRVNQATRLEVGQWNGNIKSTIIEYFATLPQHWHAIIEMKGKTLFYGDVSKVLEDMNKEGSLNVTQIKFSDWNEYLKNKEMLVEDFWRYVRKNQVWSYVREGTSQYQGQYRNRFVRVISVDEALDQVQGIYGDSLEEVMGDKDISTGQPNKDGWVNVKFIQNYQQEVTYGTPTE